MLRSALFVTTVLTLAGCQMQQTGTVTTREERLAIAQATIDDCVRSECGRLDLDSKLVEDYAVLSGMTHVTALMTSFSDFSDLGAISEMSQLRELHIGATQVQDLSGLSRFPNLRLLHVQQLYNVEDFSPISELRGLEELAIGSADLGDAAFLRPLRNLRALNMDYADLTSLEVLRGHPRLETLDLVDARLPDDLSVLTSIPNLKTLSISDWDLSEEQLAVVSALEARGVAIDRVAAVIVC